MLLLGSDAILVEGVMVYPDHADPNQFWYLPAPVALAQTGEGDDQKLSFTFIKYKPDAVAQVKGGGFVMFTLALKLTPEQEGRILAKVSEVAESPADARLAPVPFDDGTVQCIALDLQGSGGTTAAATQPPGTLSVVEKILGATTPSLFGDDNASFSVSLSEQGASLVEACFEDGLSPIGAIYNLKFTAVRPALDVEITADLKKAYEGFSIGLTAQAYYVSAGIDAAFEKLKQDGVIKIKVVNLTTDEENKKKEDLALDLFKSQLINEWFKPSLANGKADVDAGTPTLPASGGRPTNSSASATGAQGAARPHAPPSGSNPGGGAAQPGAGGAGALHPTSATHPASGSGTPAAPGAVVSAPTAGAGAAPAGGAGGASALPPVAPAATAPAATAPAPVAAPPAAGGASGLGGAAAAGAAAAGGAGGTNVASPFGVALRLKYVQQEELKTLTISYQRQDAVQRTYAPQGFFGLMLGNADKDKYFTEIDLHDQFFTQMDVNLTPPKDFDSIGLMSAHVALDYGDPSASDSKHGEFDFDAQNHAGAKWSVYRNAALDTQYTYAVDYHFDPQSGWDGEKLSYQLPAVTTENQELFITPFEQLGFLQINVAPAKINWTVMDSIEVDCHYQSKSGWVSDKQFIVRSDTKAQPWKLRLADKTDNSYSYQLKHYLQDGTIITGETVTARATTILVNDPFDANINVQVVPTLDASKTKQAFVDVQYDDPAHGYSHAETITLLPGQPAAVKVRIPILDNTLRTWRYRVTLVGPGEQVNRGAFVETSETLIIITDGGEK